MITVAIPTYRRGRIALATIESLLSLARPPAEVILADQTPDHPADVAAALAQMACAGRIVWLRFDKPSIPHAMNAALTAATSDIVLFLDDDIEPSPGLIAAHEDAHRASGASAVVGQILQPGESPQRIVQSHDPLQFRFNSSDGTPVLNVMAGNLSVARHAALEIGGFDENFIGAAYRFETDFAYRLVAAGHLIWFEPQASLKHLKLSTGGLRAFGDHFSSASPNHSVGDYYFALRHVESPPVYFLHRLRQNVLTRHHLRNPWTIPTKIVGELRGMLLARRLMRKGPRLLEPPQPGGGNSGHR